MPNRIDYRSFKDLGLAELPSIHLGAAACNIEKRNIRTKTTNPKKSDLIETNQLIKEYNQSLKKLTKQENIQLIKELCKILYFEEELKLRIKNSEQKISYLQPIISIYKTTEQTIQTLQSQIYSLKQELSKKNILEFKNKNILNNQILKKQSELEVALEYKTSITTNIDDIYQSLQIEMKNLQTTTNIIKKLEQNKNKIIQA